MGYKRDSRGGSAIRAAIFLELAGVTIWKVSSYFSQDTVGCAYVILIAAITGFYMFRAGVTQLLGSCSAYKGWGREGASAIFAVVATLAAFALPFSFLLGLTSLSDIKHSMVQLAGRDGVILGEYTGDRRWVRIPERINGKEVLGDSTFAGCTSLDEIVLPKNLEYIGKYCFNYSNLTTFGQDGADIQIVGPWAFDNTPWYDEQIQENDMVLIGGNLIYYNMVGESVHLPEGPRVILQDALRDNVAVS